MKAGSSGGRSWGPGGDGDGHCELAQLFYRLRPGGGPGGAVPDGAGGLPVSESPRAEAAAILAAALGCVLVLQYGGGALLEERGLFWRGWVQTALSLTGGGLAVLLLAGTIRGLGALCLGKDWVTAVCVLGCAAALLGAAACAGAGLVGSGGREQVVRLAGETLVVRDADLLHQVGWRYVNLFVHGEPLACWRVS